MTRVSALIQIWRRSLDLLRRSCPWLSVAVFAMTILEAATSVAVLYSIKLISDAVSARLNADHGGADQVYLLLLLSAGGAVFAVVVQNVGNMLRLRQSLCVSEFVDREIHDRAISLDLQSYETARYHDALERARQGGGQRPAQSISNMILMLRGGIMLGATLVLLAGIDIALIPILLVPVLIALVARIHYTRELFQWTMSRAQKERRTAYLDWLLTSAHHAKELRLNRMGSFLRDKYGSLRAEISRGHLKIETARLRTDLVIAVIGGGVFLVASAWLLERALKQQLPIGDVVLFVLLLRRAESSGNEFVGNISKTVDDHLYLRRLFDFLATTPIIRAPPAPLELPVVVDSGIRLTNVSFRYDGASSPAVNDVSLQIRPGQIVALVGENGSGKTTLIKLLTRLYDPTSGAVELDGTDIRQFDPDQYRSLFSVIFQDYATYAETAAENIRYGDTSLFEDSGRIRDAAERAGAASFIERLPQSYDTPLTKMFDNGQDLSVGQWQRLALARAFFPRSKFMILDEPTSAVDAKAEFELFEDFRERLGGRGALIISHRLSTIRMADFTYVLHEGRIIETGKHDELIAAGGHYADLFEKQGQNYR
jgi:ATP-binding cassette, subfamily B, bacterial